MGRLYVWRRRVGVGLRSCCCRCSCVLAQDERGRRGVGSAHGNDRHVAGGEQVTGPLGGVDRGGVAAGGIGGGGNGAGDDDGREQPGRGCAAGPRNRDEYERVRVGPGSTAGDQRAGHGNGLAAHVRWAVCRYGQRQGGRRRGNRRRRSAAGSRTAAAAAAAAAAASASSRKHLAGKLGQVVVQAGGIVEQGADARYVDRRALNHCIAVLGRAGRGRCRAGVGAHVAPGASAFQTGRRVDCDRSRQRDARTASVHDSGCAAVPRL